MIQMVKNLPAVLETQVWSQGQEDPQEKRMVTHSSIVAERIPWTEEPGGLQSIKESDTTEWLTLTKPWSKSKLSNKKLLFLTHKRCAFLNTEKQEFMAPVMTISHMRWYKESRFTPETGFWSVYSVRAMETSMRGTDSSNRASFSLPPDIYSFNFWNPDFLLGKPPFLYA